MSDLLNQASLVMVPSGYKEDTVYSVVPSDGSGDLSFTRASNGTRINSAGLVEVCPWNLSQNSEQFNAATWGLAFLSILTDSAVAPNGTTTADLLYPSSSQAYCYASTTQISVIAGQTYTQSVYLKRSGFRWGIVDNMAGSPGAWFDLLNGVVGNVSSGCTASIENVGNGWYRCSVTSVAPASTNYADFRMSDSNGGGAVTANGNDGLLAWGFQLNLGSTAKPYFPTTDRLNVPRLTYQNGGGGCPSLLLEKQSTNLVTYSEQFDNAAFTVATNNGTLTRTANYGVSPDGTQNADRLQMSITAATSNYSQLYQLLTVTSGQTYTWSVYIKSLSGTPTIGWAYDGANWQNITVTTDWVRYTRTTTALSINVNADFLLYHNIGTSSSADILVWGYQIEASSYPTSYIPTTSSSATRVADVAFKTSATALIGQTEGTLFADFLTSGFLSIDQYFMNISDGSTSNIVYIGFYSNILVARVIDAGALVVNINVALATNTRYKVAFAYKANDCILYINGSNNGSDTSASIPACSKLSYNDFSNEACYQLNESVLFKTRLTNAELASLTTI